MRNTTLFDLTKELDAAALGALLGYSTQIMTAHAARSGNIIGSYPATKQDQSKTQL